MSIMSFFSKNYQNCLKESNENLRRQLENALEIAENYKNNLATLRTDYSLNSISQEESHQRELAYLQSKYDLLVLSKDNDIKVEKAKILKQAQEELDLKRKEVRNSHNNELERLTKENGELVKKSADVHGRYEGALIVIKNLEAQVRSLTDLTGKFFANLPTVNLKSPEAVNVSVNN